MVLTYCKLTCPPIGLIPWLGVDQLRWRKVVVTVLCVVGLNGGDDVIWDRASER